MIKEVKEITGLLQLHCKSAWIFNIFCDLPNSIHRPTTDIG